MFLRNSIKVTLLFFLTLTALPALSQEETGMCSYYGNKFHGRRTASGEYYNRYSYTAAHRTLPFNTLVEVTNLGNGKKVVVRINDRGPHSKNRIIDLSRAAAEDIGMIPNGVVKVSLVLTTENPPPDKPAPEKKQGPSAAPSGKNEPVLEAGFVYDKELKRVPVVGYGVQTGSYRHLNPCMSSLLRFEKSYGVKGYIQFRQKGNSKTYILVMGDYDNRNGALLLREKLQKDAPGCFVLEWDALRAQ